MRRADSNLTAVFNWLRDHGWPIPDGDVQDLTFDHAVSEIILLRNEAFAVRRLLQLRPLPDFAQTVFLLDSPHQCAPNRIAIRRIAVHFMTRPHTRAPRANFDLDRMLFLTVCQGGALYVSHLSGESALQSRLALIGPIDVASDPPTQLIQWENVAGNGVRFEEEEYVRHDRGRSGRRCTLRFLERFSPDHIPLFERAQRARSIGQVEEDYLFARIRKGNRKALERVVDLNLTKVFDTAYSVFRAYAICTPCFDEIVAAALEGLMSSIRAYDARRANRFATYSWPRIYQNAVRGLVSGLYPVSIPMYVWDGISPSIKALNDSGDPAGSVREDCSAFEPFGLTDDQLEHARALISKPNQPVMAQSIRWRADEEVAYRTRGIDTAMAFVSAADKLKRRDADVLMHRLGIHPCHFGQEFTLEEVGQMYCVTRERARQIELRAKEKLLRSYPTPASLLGGH
jgi:RNA polymerase primary sigma factor